MNFIEQKRLEFIKRWMNEEDELSLIELDLLLEAYKDIGARKARIEEFRRVASYCSGVDFN